MGEDSSDLSRRPGARRGSGARRGAAGAMVLLAATFAGSAVTAQTPAAPGDVQIAANAKAEDFLVVDCVLPQQLRRLGTRMTYAAPRRAIKTTTRDCEIRGGEYVSYDRANYATALKVWLDGAKQGDAKSQTYVGEIYEKGLGTAPDYAAAAEWYRRAAEQGYAAAAINLGGLYEKGLGVPRDPRAALTWYRRASGLTDLTYEIAPDPLDHRVVQLETEIEQYRRELDARRGDVGAAQRDAQELRQALAERDAEVQAARAELAEQRRELQALEARERSATAGQDALRMAIQEREARLQAKEREAAALQARQPKEPAAAPAPEREVREIQTKLTRAESDARAQKAGLEPPRWERDAAGGPDIELLSVQLVEPQVVVAAGGRRDGPPGGAPGGHLLLVVGRVASSATIRSFTINGIEQIVDASPTDTRFRAELNLPGTQADKVKLVALDGNRRRTALELGVPARVQLAATGTGPATERASLPAPPSTGGTYHALVIGIGDYARLDRLDTPPSDARAVAAALAKDYGFKVRTVINASRVQIMAQLNDLRERLTAQDNVLIYYAGRGDLDPRSQRGYWLPADAQPNTPGTWISDVQLSDVLNVLPVRQLLVVADSPYAATLTRSANGRLEPTLSDPHFARIMQMMSGKRSRMVMTSGGVQPTVETAGLPPSIFAKSFIEVLQSNGGVMLGRDVYRGVQVKLYAAARRIGITQMPNYAPIKYAGHDGGDFFFVKISS